MNLKRINNLKGLDNYQFNISKETLDVLKKIASNIALFDVELQKKDYFKLKKIQDFKTIQGTCAIEGNNLRADVIQEIIDQKHVSGPENEVSEIKNTSQLYSFKNNFEYSSSDDFKKAHFILMQNLIDRPGHYRECEAGIKNNNKWIFISPTPSNVEALMDEVFLILESDKYDLILKSCLAHFYIELIHPFKDGNGRMGRFWQYLILNSEHENYSLLAIENIINEDKNRYYEILNYAQVNCDIEYFVKYLLQTILKATEDIKFYCLSNSFNSRYLLAKSQISKRQKFKKKEYAALFPLVSYPTLSRDLQRMVKENLVNYEGSGNGTVYFFA